jgi:hypothetical protein
MLDLAGVTMSNLRPNASSWASHSRQLDTTVVKRMHEVSETRYDKDIGLVIVLRMSSMEQTCLAREWRLAW